MSWTSRLMALVAAVALIWVMARPYQICGNRCMEPALKHGARCLVNQLTPFFRTHKVGDIIMFEHEGKTWVSRIAALEGNSVEVRENHILVDGAQLRDSVDRNWKDWSRGSYAVSESFKVPEGHIFAVSDNLESVHDSRMFGPIKHSKISGLVWWVL